MAETVETAIYKLGIETGDSKEKVERLRVEMEKLGDSGDKSERGLNKLISRLDETGRVANSIKLDQVRAQINRFSEEGVGSTDKLATALDLANKKYGEQAKIIPETANATNAFGKVLQWLGLQHQSAGAEAEAHGRSTNAIKDAMHLLRPAAEAAGASISNIGPFAAAARLGLTGLGIAITGGVVVALIEAADKARVLRTQLDALTGNRESGGAAFAGLKQSAAEAGVSVSTLAGAYFTLLQAQQKSNAERGIRFVPGAEGETKQIKDLASAIELAGKAGLASEKQSAQVLEVIGQSIIQNGKLTVGAFQDIIKISQPLARAIADALGGKDKNFFEFAKSLEASSAGFDKISGAMSRAMPQLKEAADQTVPTLAQRWEHLTTQIETSAGQIAESLNVNKLMANFTTGLKLLTGDTGTFFAALGEMVSAGAQRVVQAEIDILLKGPAVLAAALASSTVEIAKWVANSLAAFASVVRAIPSAPNYGGGPPGVSAPYMIPTAGGLGSVRPSQPAGIGNEGLPPFSYIDPNTGLYPGIGSDEIPLARGTDTVIPPGYPNDTFKASMNLTSGERLIVVPNNRSLSDFIGGGEPINLGSFADGLNAMVGPPSGDGSQGPRIDAAILPQGNRLLDLGVSYGELLDKVGVTLDDWRQTITGAGNDDLPDVIRQSTVQIIASAAMGSNKIVSTLNTAVVGAINAMGEKISASQAAAASAASAASSGGFSAAGQVNPYAGLPNVITPLGGIVPLGYPANYGPGVPAGGGAAPGAVARMNSRDGGKQPLPDVNAENAGFAAQAAAELAARRRGAAAFPPTPSSWPGNSVGGAGPPSRPIPPGTGAFDTGGTSGTDLSPYYADQGYSGDSGASYEGFYAEGGSFRVPAGFPNDSFVAKLNLTTGENVKISKAPDDLRRGGGSSVIDQRQAITVNVAATVVISADAVSGKSPQQAADELARKVGDAIAAKSSANRSISTYSRTAV